MNALGLATIFHGTLLLLAVINPIGSIPVFAELTQQMDGRSRRKTFNTAIIISLAMMVFFTLLGDWCMREVFDLTLAEFQITGGILLFIVATRGVLDSTPQFNVGNMETGMLATFPIAFPLIVGPGSLAMTIMLAQKSGVWNMLSICILTMIVVFFIIRNVHRVMSIVGPYAGLVIARMLFIFLAAKAVAIVLEGLRGTDPQWLLALAK